MPEPGEPFYQPDLAKTLAAAESGADAFYHGEIARSIARSVQKAGGYLDEEDLAAHESLPVESIHTDYNGIRVYSRSELTETMIRATLIFRREDGIWKAVHRHGDERVAKAPPS